MQEVNPYMIEFAKVVSGLYKAVKLMKECSWLTVAEKIPKKHKGWTAVKEDITGPTCIPAFFDEILVKDDKGNIRVINGYTLKPSKHAERQAYLSHVARWDDEKLDDFDIKEPARRRARKGRPMKSYMNDLYNYVPKMDERGEATGEWELVPYKNIKSSAAGYLRKQSSPNPRTIFRRMMKTIWDDVKKSFPEGMLPEQKLRIYGICFNNEYTKCVVKPVLDYMKIDFSSIPYLEDLRKITISAAFK